MDNKRDSLKKLAGISAVVSVSPNAWLKPVVNSVVLPTHAQTSERCELLSFSGSVTPNSGIVQVGDKIAIQVTYALTDNQATDVELNIGATSTSLNGVLSNVAGETFTGVSTSGTQTIEAEVLLVDPDTVFTEIIVTISLDAIASNNQGCFDFELLTIPVNLTGS